MNPNETTPVPLNQPLYGAGPNDAITRFFKKYTVFKGRASRSEFWWVIALIVAINLFTNAIAKFSYTTGIVLEWMWFLAIVVPFMALCARRAQDTNRPGGVGIAFVVCYYLMLIAGTYSGITTRQYIGRIPTQDLTARILPASVFTILIGIPILVLFIFLVLKSNPMGVRFDDGNYNARTFAAQQTPYGSASPYAPAASYAPANPVAQAQQQPVYMAPAQPIQQVQPAGVQPAQQPVQPTQPAQSMQQVYPDVSGEPTPQASATPDGTDNEQSASQF